MHLHGLKLLIALVIILGNAIHPASLVSSSTQYYFNQVADFDDIIEENKDSVANFKESSKNQEPEKSLEQRSDLFENARLISPSRIKTDVQGKDQISPAGESQQNVPFQSQRQNQPDVIFETPVLYEMGDRPQRRGYFMVKQRKPDGATHIHENPSFRNVQEDGIIETFNLKSNHGNVTNSEESIKEHPQNVNNASDDTLECQGFQKSEHKPMQEPGDANTADFDKTCHQLFELFHQIPLVEKVMEEMMEKNDPRTMNNSWKSIKCIIREQYPNMAKNNILERPESKNCFRRYVRRRRRKRHSTYINLRNPRKKINNNLAKRNVENDHRFKNIIDFIIKNKEFMDKYTYVPIVFATVKELSTKEKEATTQMTANFAEELKKSQNFENNNTPPTTPSPFLIPPSSQPSPLLITSSNKPSPQLIPPSSQPSSLPILPASPTKSMPILPLSQSMQMNYNLENTGVHVDTTPASAVSGQSEPQNGPSTANGPVNVLLSQQARNLTNELNFRIPQLRRSFQDIMEIMNSQAGLNRVKKEVNVTQPSVVQSFTEKTPLNDRIVAFPNNQIGQQSTRIDSREFQKFVNVSSIVLPPPQISNNFGPNLTSESKTFNEKDMIPGVLIYLVTEKNDKNKRNIFDLLDKDDTIESVTFGNEIMDEQVTVDSLETMVNPKFIDLNPQPKLKKEVHDCQNETEEMLNVLKSLNMKTPEDNDSPKKYSNDKFGSHSDLSNISTESTDHSIDTTESTIESEQANAPDFNSLSSMNMTKLLEINPDEFESIYGITSPKNAKVESDLNEKNFEIPSMDNEEWCSTSLGTEAPCISDIQTISTTEFPLSVCSNDTSEISGSQTSTSSVNTTEKTTISIVTRAIEASISASSSSTMKESKEGTTSNPAELKDSMTAKLKRLQKDLKLVNEVQNILNGISNLERRQEKRSLPSQALDTSSTEKSLFELNFKVVSDLAYKEKEVSGLGKILDWKAKSDEKCREKRRSKKRKKQRKRKHRHQSRNRRFLGQRPQNLL